MTNKDPWSRTPEEQFRDAKARVQRLENAKPKPGTIAAAERACALYYARLYLTDLRQLALPGIE